MNAVEVLRKTQRVSDEFLDNLLKSVEDFNKQAHTPVLGVDGWFRDFSRRWKGSLRASPKHPPHSFPFVPHREV